jgi:hypothetical protein
MCIRVNSKLHGPRLEHDLLWREYHIRLIRLLHQFRLKFKLQMVIILRIILLFRLFLLDMLRHQIMHYLHQALAFNEAQFLVDVLWKLNIIEENVQLSLARSILCFGVLEGPLFFIDDGRVDEVLNLVHFDLFLQNLLRRVCDTDYELLDCVF